MIGAGPDLLLAARKALHRVPQLAASRDVHIDLLHGGNHSSFLVETADTKFVLRLAGPAAALAAAPDIDHEYAVLSLLSAEDLAPRPVYADPGRGILLVCYLDGRVLSPADLQLPDYLEPLATVLARVHRHAWDRKLADPVAATKRYLGMLDRSSRFRVPVAAMRQRLSAVSGCFESAGSPVLCHNDLLSGNIHKGTKLRLLDWEYAGGGDPWFDIATLICYHDMGAEARHCLVDAYRRRGGSAMRAERLDGLCVLVDCQTLAWSLARLAGGVAVEADARLARSAAARLGIAETFWD